MASTTDIRKVQFFYQEVSFTFTHRTLLKQYLLTLFQHEKTQLESLIYIFCTDDYLLSINKQYLNHDYYTDIITFDLSVPGAKAITGEVYISIDRVHENASTYRHSFKEELLRVIFHGALHLCGFRDKTPIEVSHMRGAEDFHLIKFNSHK